MNVTPKLIILSLFSFSTLKAATIHTESINGELSGLGTAPTSLGTLALGASDVIGQVGGDARDHFTFSIATGQLLDSITMLSGTGSDHFWGLDDGSTFGTNASSLLIATLISGVTSETPDFLDTFAGGGMLFGSASGASGVTGSSLGPGDYTILMNETAAGTFDYQFRLTVVPEPSSTLLISFASLGLLLRRKR